MGSAEGARRVNAIMLATGARGGPGLLELRRSTPAGLCPFCLDPIENDPHRRGPKRRHCQAPECRTAYVRTWKRDRVAGRLMPGQLLHMRRGLELGTG